MHYIYDFGQCILIIFANCMKAIISNYDNMHTTLNCTVMSNLHMATMANLDLQINWHAIHEVNACNYFVIGFQPYSYLWIKN